MKETKFKETEVGRVPADWEVKTLGEISKDTAYGVAAEATTYDGKNRYIRITDISDENGSFQPNPLTSPSFFNDEHIVKENDLLVARTGATVGKTYIYRHSDGKLVYAGFLIKTNICKADSKYVFYYTQTYPYKLWVISESMRSGQPGINAEQLKTLNIPLPPLPEQRRISTALSDIDSLISSLDELLEKKRNIKQGTMQQLLTAKTRLNGFSEPWVEKKLGEIGVWFKGQPFSKSELNGYGKNKCIHYGELFTLYHENITKVHSYTNSKVYTASKVGDILFPASDVTPTGLGRCSALMECEVLLGGDLLVLRPTCQVDSVCLSYIINKNKKAIIDLVTGTTVKHINSKALSSIKVSIPSSLPEQCAIASILTAMDNEIQALQAQRDKYTLIKQGMMQQLLTGKIRI